MKLTYNHREVVTSVDKEELREKYDLYRRFYPHLSDIDILKNVYVNYMVIPHTTDEWHTVAYLDMSRNKFAARARRELGLKRRKLWTHKKKK